MLLYFRSALYLLRSNLKGDNPALLWQYYIQLTEVEQAFKTGLSDRQRRDLLEILDDRYGTRSTLVTSQLPVDHWHESIGDPTLADAILDRLVHNAHRIALKGKSKRKREYPALGNHDGTDATGG